MPAEAVVNETFVVMGVLGLGFSYFLYKCVEKLERVDLSNLYFSQAIQRRNKGSSSVHPRKWILI